MCCIFCYLLPATFSFVKPALELDFLFAGLTVFRKYTIINKNICYSVLGESVERNQVHNEIKAIIAQNGLTLTEVVTRMNQHRTPDERTTVQNISNKLARGTIKYSEALEMAAVIGLRITWDKTKNG